MFITVYQNLKKPIAISSKIVWAALLFLYLPLSVSATQLEIVKGFNEQGLPSNLWLQAVRTRHSNQSWLELHQSKKLMTKTEQLWFEAIEQQLVAFNKSTAGIHIAFDGITPPQKVNILLGNQGGNDGFTLGLDTICFDLADWVRAYGHPDKSTRIVRVLSHEYSHLLTKLWLKEHKVKMETSLDRALWTLFYEGLGTYRSLSEKWFSADKTPSELAQKTLAELTPIFVEQLIKLSSASDENESQLTRNMTSGSFRKQWGSLTVGIWLANESKGDDAKLTRWINMGPEGILILANKYLPQAHKERLMAGLKNRQSGE